MQDKVLAVLRKHDQPQSAYDLLGQMREDNPQLAPTSIYRALDALTKRGAVHRLESKKAFIVCRHGDHADGCIMAICDECGAVEERVAPGLIENLSAEAAKSGFAPTKHVIEVHGQCATCGSESGLK
ncbi:MAG: Fur family transcriptional regulator [Pseudomonadota bacterium]